MTLEALRGMRHLPYVLPVIRIPFHNRQSRIAGRQPFGLCLQEVDLLARRVTQVVPGKGGGAQSPSGICRQRHSHLREADTSDVVPISIGFWNEDGIGGTQENRREDRQNALIERRPEVEQVSCAYKPIVRDPRDVRKTYHVLRQRRDQRAILTPRRTALRRLLAL